MFKIGQKVVCKNDRNTSNINGIPKGINRGQIYTICGFSICSYCGAKFIHLAGVNSGSMKKCICNGIACNPPNTFLEWRFESLKYEIVSNMEIIKELITERSDITAKEPVKNKLLFMLE